MCEYRLPNPCLALFTSGFSCILHAQLSHLVQGAGSNLLVGILACELIACIFGSCLTCCIDETTGSVKQSDRVDVNRPDVVPPANGDVVNPANRPPAKAPTKAPKHRPPNKAIPLPDMFFTA
ncbi:uncharacterized protein [Apostichopus japonicus]|uniref:uncharacterized protein isoform X3 n=1 Tax=Stichopus japonicus TaxID=307972 RepID=UPI003AB25D10